MSVDIGIFKGMESGMLRGIFIKAKFEGMERGTFIKDMANEEMEIGKGMIREVDISNGDLESGGGVESGEEQLGVGEEGIEEGCASLVITPVIVVVEPTS